MRLFAIDPGTTHSAFVDMRDDHILQSGKWDNETLLAGLRVNRGEWDVVVIEQIESYGMPVGMEVLATVHWSGRFAEAVHPTPFFQLPRRNIKLHLCNSARAKDANVRQALIDRFGGSAAIGRKASPGPLYGIHSDQWAALAVAIVYSDLASNP